MFWIPVTIVAILGVIVILALGVGMVRKAPKVPAVVAPKVDLGGRIFLINQERVLLEMLELARLRVAGVLKIPETAVTARIDWDEDTKKPQPVFMVDDAFTEGVSNGQVREVMAGVYSWMRIELAARLEGLNAKRPRSAKAAT